MATITPNLWFDHDAAEAVAFYASVFPDGRIGTTSYYPAEGLLDFQQSLAGQELTIDFELGGQAFTAINAGPEFRFNPSLSFMVNVDPARDGDARAHLDELWEALLDGGEALMPLDAYPFSPHFGWVQDRFGLSWQLILTDPAGEPRPFILPTLMFSEQNTNRAREALDYYTGVFDDSELATIATYEQASGPAAAGSVMFADFTLAGHWFAAMDAAADHGFSFNESVSFSVACADQAEIDRYWAALSRVPEAEQCGWCKDQFGLSWQIVPAEMASLMSRPGAFEAMLAMRKIEIAGF